MSSYNFVQLDVFTRTAFAGNPLAVFPDGHGLSDQQMQAIAREMNLSETTFIFPRKPEEERQKGARVRIFTVAEELPFAGHPTLGTALYLYSTSDPAKPPEELVLDLKVGRVPVRFRPDSADAGKTRVDGAVFGEMRQRDPNFGPMLEREKVASALRIKVEEISAEWPIQVVSTGLPFAILPLRDGDALARIKFNPADAESILDGTDAKFFYLLSAEKGSGEVRARMLFYGGEDPATGSAAGCAASWLVRHGIVPSDREILVRQGVEAGRPSEITVRASKEGDRITNVRVGGRAIEVLRGTLQI